MSKRPVALIIMDGFGYNPDAYGNAIRAAKKPNLEKYLKGPHTLIGASGLDVGLPDGQMGNSEVGHTNIGAGRIVYQMLVKITKDIENGTFFSNPALSDAMDACKEKGTALHLMGLLSPGGVHSHMSHLYGLLEMAKKKGLSKVYVHAFLDGRDEPPASAAGFMKEAAAKMQEIGVGKIATISGRYYAMDRDNAWDRVEKAYAAMVYGEGVTGGSDPVQAIEDSYANDVTDEFMLPTVLDKDGVVKPEDSVIFFNFRPDRARQLTRCFVDPEFSGFSRRNGYFPVQFVCMAQYDASMPNVTVAYPPEDLHMTFGEYVSKEGPWGMTATWVSEDSSSYLICKKENDEPFAKVTAYFQGVDGWQAYELHGRDRIAYLNTVENDTTIDSTSGNMKFDGTTFTITDLDKEIFGTNEFNYVITDKEFSPD